MREQAEAADEAVRACRRAARHRARELPGDAGADHHRPVLPRFLAAHPQVRIDMQVSNRVVDLVQEGVDVALRVRANLDDSGTLVIKNLGPTHGVLIASPQLLQRFGQPKDPEELRNLPTVAMSAADGRATWHLHGPRGAQHELQHHPVYTADDLLTLKFAVLQGTGMCVLPDYMCTEELRRGELVPVLPGWEPPKSRVLAVFPSRRGMVPAVRRFLDFLGDNLVGERIVGDAAATASA
jgi:DNA-binding transcriptional LysR family regulator